MRVKVPRTYVLFEKLLPLVALLCSDEELPMLLICLDAGRAEHSSMCM